MPVKQSQSSSNLYFEVKVQASKQEDKIVKVMHQKGDDSKRQVFVDKVNAQQPVIPIYLRLHQEQCFFNKGAGIQDVPSHTITFQYEVQDPFEVTMVRSLMKSTTGNFNVLGSIKWKGEAHIPSEKSTQSVLDATLTEGLSHCLYGVNTLQLLKKETSTRSQTVNCATFMGRASQLLNQPRCPQPKNKIWPKLSSRKYKIGFAAMKFLMWQ